MKLRVRMQAGVAKLEVPDICTLRELGERVAVDVLHLEPSTPVVLSFNKKDPLMGAPGTLLREAGVCNGDLLWLLSPAAPSQPPAAAGLAAPPPVPAAEPIAKRSREDDAPFAAGPEQQAVQAQAAAATAVNKGKQAISAEVLEGGQEMAADQGESGEPEDPLPPSQRVPSYLLHTLQHSCGADTKPTDLLLLAAHAAMLETGFVPRWEGQPGGGSSSSSSSTEAYKLPHSCWASSSICRIQYDLLPTNGGGSSSMDSEPAGESEQQGEHVQEQQAAPACTLQCSSMGGSVVLAVATRQHTRHLALQAASCVHPLTPALAQAAGAPAEAAADGSAGPSTSSGVAGTVSAAAGVGADAAAGGAVRLLPGGGLAVCGRLQLDPASVKQLWTRLKDGLAFPMLLAAYVEAGLQPPAGLLALPEDLKQRVLAALGPQDLAALCGVCSELRHLASQDELWKPLFEREFAHAASYYATQAQHRGVKWAFGQCWRERRQREEGLRRARNRMFAPAVPRFGVPRPPPFYPPPPGPGFPGIVGGDYDRLPQFGPGGGFPGLPGQFGGTAPGGLFFGGGGSRRQGRGGLGGFRMH